ncbi:Aste57867_10430 [Aphanomyces stellatus]|uniref:Aste57867_10430 protein n=1 Tax=Aphanomyces stellatus TaxID=120398 RepID=A0A485KQY8_9STRA|nr:hypothetical protein As57867_010390 [Aphanomyces stellatus]VFT87304.1 Aste57867_10430 [Aphanomyces stellatus]
MASPRFHFQTHQLAKAHASYQVLVLALRVVSHWPFQHLVKRQASSSETQLPMYSVGTRVDGLYDGGDVWFPGVVDIVNEANSFAILYDDGEREESVPAELLRLHVPGTFSVGSRVWALYDGGDVYFAGEIADIDCEAQTYDIAYDDGESESSVPFASIIDECIAGDLMPSAAAGGESEDAKVHDAAVTSSNNEGDGEATDAWGNPAVSHDNVVATENQERPTLTDMESPTNNRADDLPPNAVPPLECTPTLTQASTPTSSSMVDTPTSSRAPTPVQRMPTPTAPLELVHAQDVLKTAWDTADHGVIADNSQYEDGFEAASVDERVDEAPLSSRANGSVTQAGHSVGGDANVVMADMATNAIKSPDATMEPTIPVDVPQDPAKETGPSRQVSGEAKPEPLGLDQLVNSSRSNETNKDEAIRTTESTKALEIDDGASSTPPQIIVAGAPLPVIPPLPKADSSFVMRRASADLENMLAAATTDESFTNVISHQQEIESILKTVGEPVNDNDTMIVVKNALALLLQQLRIAPHVTVDCCREVNGESILLGCIQANQSYSILVCFVFVIVRRMCSVSEAAFLKFVELDVIAIVARVMRCFPHDAVLQASACGVLATFARSCGIELMIQLQVAQLIVDVLKEHQTLNHYSRQVHYYACEVLAKLCDGGDFRVLRIMTANDHVCSSAVHLFVLLLRQGHQHEDQKVACAACTLVLCLAARDRESANILRSIGALTDVSTVMAKYPNDNGIAAYSQSATREIALSSIKHGSTMKVQETAKNILKKEDLQLGGDLFEKKPPKPKPPRHAKTSQSGSATRKASVHPTGGANTPTKSAFSRNTMSPAPQLTHNVADSLTKIQQYNAQKKPSTAFEYSTTAQAIKKPPTAPLWTGDTLPVTKHTFTPFEQKLEMRLISATHRKIIPAPSPAATSQDREVILLRTYGVPKIRNIDRLRGLPTSSATGTSGGSGAAETVSARPKGSITPKPKTPATKSQSARGHVPGKSTAVVSAMSTLSTAPTTGAKPKHTKPLVRTIVVHTPPQLKKKANEKPPKKPATITVVQQNLVKSSSRPTIQLPSDMTQLATQLFQPSPMPPALTDTAMEPMRGVEARLSFSDKLHEMIKKAEVALCRPPSQQGLRVEDMDESGVKFDESELPEKPKRKPKPDRVTTPRQSPPPSHKTDKPPKQPPKQPPTTGKLLTPKSAATSPTEAKHAKKLNSSGASESVMEKTKVPTPRGNKTKEGSSISSSSQKVLPPTTSPKESKTSSQGSATVQAVVGEPRTTSVGSLDGRLSDSATTQKASVVPSLANIVPVMPQEDLAASMMVDDTSSASAMITSRSLAASEIVETPLPTPRVLPSTTPASTPAVEASIEPRETKKEVPLEPVDPKPPMMETVTTIEQAVVPVLDRSASSLSTSSSLGPGDVDDELNEAAVAKIDEPLSARSGASYEDEEFEDLDGEKEANDVDDANVTTSELAPTQVDEPEELKSMDTAGGTKSGEVDGGIPDQTCDGENPDHDVPADEPMQLQSTAKTSEKPKRTDAEEVDHPLASDHVVADGAVESKIESSLDDQVEQNLVTTSMDPTLTLNVSDHGDQDVDSHPYQAVDGTVVVGTIEIGAPVLEVAVAGETEGHTSSSGGGTDDSNKSGAEDSLPPTYFTDESGTPLSSNQDTPSHNTETPSSADDTNPHGFGAIEAVVGAGHYEEDGFDDAILTVRESDDVPVGSDVVPIESGAMPVESDVESESTQTRDTSAKAEDLSGYSLANDIKPRFEPDAGGNDMSHATAMEIPPKVSCGGAATSETPLEVQNQITPRDDENQTTPRDVLPSDDGEKRQDDRGITSEDDQQKAAAPSTVPDQVPLMDAINDVVDVPSDSIPAPDDVVRECGNIVIDETKVDDVGRKDSTKATTPLADCCEDKTDEQFNLMTVNDPTETQTEDVEEAEATTNRAIEVESSESHEENDVASSGTATSPLKTSETPTDPAAVVSSGDVTSGVVVLQPENVAEEAKPLAGDELAKADAGGDDDGADASHTNTLNASYDEEFEDLDDEMIVTSGSPIVGENHEIASSSEVPSSSQAFPSRADTVPKVHDEAITSSEIGSVRPPVEPEGILQASDKPSTDMDLSTSETSNITTQVGVDDHRTKLETVEVASLDPAKKVPAFVSNEQDATQAEVEDTEALNSPRNQSGEALVSTGNASEQVNETKSGDDEPATAVVEESTTPLVLTSRSTNLESSSPVSPTDDMFMIEPVDAPRNHESEPKLPALVGWEDAIAARDEEAAETTPYGGGDDNFEPLASEEGVDDSTRCEAGSTMALTAHESPSDVLTPRSTRDEELGLSSRDSRESNGATSEHVPEPTTQPDATGELVDGSQSELLATKAMHLGNDDEANPIGVSSIGGHREVVQAKDTQSDEPLASSSSPCTSGMEAGIKDDSVPPDTMSIELDAMTSESVHTTTTDATPWTLDEAPLKQADLVANEPVERREAVIASEKSNDGEFDVTEKVPRPANSRDTAQNGKMPLIQGGESEFVPPLDDAPHTKVKAGGEDATFIALDDGVNAGTSSSDEHTPEAEFDDAASFRIQDKHLDEPTATHGDLDAKSDTAASERQCNVVFNNLYEPVDTSRSVVSSNVEIPRSEEEASGVATVDTTDMTFGSSHDVFVVADIRVEPSIWSDGADKLDGVSTMDIVAPSNKSPLPLPDQAMSARESESESESVAANVPLGDDKAPRVPELAMTQAEENIKTPQVDAISVENSQTTAMLSDDTSQPLSNDNEDEKVSYDGGVAEANVVVSNDDDAAMAYRDDDFDDVAVDGQPEPLSKQETTQGEGGGASPKMDKTILPTERTAEFSDKSGDTSRPTDILDLDVKNEVPRRIQLTESDAQGKSPGGTESPSIDNYDNEMTPQLSASLDNDDVESTSIPDVSKSALLYDTTPSPIVNEDIQTSEFETIEDQVGSTIDQPLVRRDPDFELHSDDDNDNPQPTESMSSQAKADKKSELDVSGGVDPTHPRVDDQKVLPQDKPSISDKDVDESSSLAPELAASDQDDGKKSVVNALSPSVPLDDTQNVHQPPAETKFNLENDESVQEKTSTPVVPTVPGWSKAVGKNGEDDAQLDDMQYLDEFERLGSQDGSSRSLQAAAADANVDKEPSAPQAENAIVEATASTTNSGPESMPVTPTRGHLDGNADIIESAITASDSQVKKKVDGGNDTVSEGLATAVSNNDDVAAAISASSDVSTAPANQLADDGDNIPSNPTEVDNFVPYELDVQTTPNAEISASGSPVDDAPPSVESKESVEDTEYDDEFERLGSQSGSNRSLLSQAQNKGGSEDVTVSEGLAVKAIGKNDDMSYAINGSSDATTTPNNPPVDAVDNVFSSPIVNEPVAADDFAEYELDVEQTTPTVALPANAPGVDDAPSSVTSKQSVEDMLYDDEFERLGSQSGSSRSLLSEPTQNKTGVDEPSRKADNNATSPSTPSIAHEIVANATPRSDHTDEYSDDGLASPRDKTADDVQLLGPPLKAPEPVARHLSNPQPLVEMESSLLNQATDDKAPSPTLSDPFDDELAEYEAMQGSRRLSSRPSEASKSLGNVVESENGTTDVNSPLQSARMDRQESLAKQARTSEDVMGAESTPLKVPTSPQKEQPQPPMKKAGSGRSVKSDDDGDAAIDEDIYGDDDFED